MNATITNLNYVKAQIEEALEKVNLMIAEEEEKERAANSGKFVAYCDLYVFPEATQMFDRTTPFCHNMEERGKILGIHYHEEQPVIRVTFSSTGEDEYSWTDHGLPQDLIASLGMDPTKRFYAPGHIPLSIVQNHITGDKVVFDLSDKVQIVATLTAGANDSLPSVVFDDTVAMIPLYRKLVDNEYDSDRGKYAYYVGLCYENGWGAIPDQGRAERWFRKAAKLGNKRASWRCGIE